MKINIIIFAITIYAFVFQTDIFAEDKDKVPEKAIQFINDGKFDKARDELNNFRKKNPDNPLAIFYLAEIEQDVDKAKALYKEAERFAEPELAAEAYYKRAEIEYSLDNVAEAKILYEQFSKIYPESGYIPKVYYLLGCLNLSEGKPEDALKIFENSMKKDVSGQNRVYALTGIMECYVALEDWNKAMDSAISALKEKDDLGSFTPRILEVLSISWQKLGNSENSGKFAERLSSNYPQSYQGYIAREEGNNLSQNMVHSDNHELNSILSDSSGSGKNIPKFSVQVSAFSERNNALKMLRVLKNAGFDARVDMKSVEGKNFYVIRVGYFVKREEAEANAEKITKVLGTKANVVVLN